MQQVSTVLLVLIITSLYLYFIDMFNTKCFYSSSCYFFVYSISNLVHGFASHGIVCVVL